MPRNSVSWTFLDFPGAKCVLVERDGLRHIGNDQMPVMKAIMDCVSGGHVFLLLSGGFVLCSSATGNRNETMPRTAGLDSSFS